MPSTLQQTIQILHSKIAKINPSDQQRILRIDYKGALAGSDYFLSFAVNPGVHPLEPVMGNNAYLKRLKDRPALHMIIAGERSVITSSATSDAAATNISLPTFKSSAVTVVNKVIAGSSSTVSPPERGHFSISEGANGLINVNMGNMSAPDSDYPPYASDAPLADDGNGSYTAACKQLYSQNDSPSVNVYAFNADHSELLANLSNYGIVNEKLGFRLYKMVDGEISNFPRIVGLRRIIYMAGGAYAACAYLLGEGKDIMVGNATIYMYRRNNYQIAIFNVNHSASCDRNPATLLSSFSPKRDPGLDILVLYPLSYAAGVITSLEGSFHNTVSWTEEDNTALAVTKPIKMYSSTVIMNVSSAVGILDKSTITEYVDSGLGVVTPQPKEMANAITKSWDKVGAGVAFRIKPYRVSGLTVKETRVYKAYKKRRERACKANNFMELDYNDEYTWKEVDNKISNMTGGDVLSIDASIIGKSASRDVTVMGTGLTINLTETGGTYSWTDNKGQNGSFPKEGLENWLGTLPTAPVLTGNGVAAASAQLNTDLTALSSDARGTAGQYSLLSTSITMSTVPEWEKFAASHDYDEQVAFLASQVTDYAKFNAGITKFVRSLMGDNVYPRLADEFIENGGAS